MRLLAYGGTRFAERARVGRWPDSLTAAGSDFEDTFDMPSGAGLLSYGVGVIDAAAVLILRERQNEQDRGGYPYTLLLDPGSQLWQAFGWNGPRLALALRADATLWTDLLREPERLATEALLAERLTTVEATEKHRTTQKEAAHGSTRFNTDSSSHGSTRFNADSASHGSTRFNADSSSHGSTRFNTDSSSHGSTRFNADSSSHGSTRFNTDSSNHGSTRFNTDSASHGSTRFNTEALGAALVATLDADSLYFPIAAVGLDARPSLEDMAAALESLPAFVRVSGGWMMGGGKTGRASFGCRAVFDDVSPAGEVDARTREAMERGRDVLAETRAVVKRHPASRVTAVLNAPAFNWDGGSEAVLGALAAVSLAAKGAADKGTIDAIAAFVSKGSPYSREVLESCTLEQASAVATALISRAPDVDSIFDMTADAVRALHARGAGADVVDPVVNAAVQRTLALQGVMRAWIVLEKRQDVWGLVRDAITAAARARVGTDARWHIDYALLAGDPGGAWLVKKHPGAIPDVVAALLSEIDADAHTTYATRWLEALATSPARARGTLAEKIQVARHLGGRWRRLVALDQVCSGDSPAAIDAPPPTDDESRALLRELRELLDARGRRVKSRPQLDLAALDRVLEGKLDVGELSRSISALCPVTPASMEWLARRGASALARDLTVRSWLDGFEESVPLSRLDADGQRALVDGVFGGDRTPTDGDRTLARNLLRAAAAPAARTLTEFVAESLTTAAGDKRRAAYIANLMAPEPDLTAAILGWIEPREAAALLQCAAEADVAIVAQAIALFWSDVVERLPESAISAVRALEEFLRRPSQPVRVVRDRVGRTLYGSDAAQFVAHVGDVRRSMESAAPASGDGEHGSRPMAWLRRFFGS